MQLLFKLKVWLTYILATRSQTPLQIELPSVLILSGLRMVNAHDSPWVHANWVVFSFVSVLLGVVRCVCWWRRTCCQYLRWVLLVATCIDCQALDPSSDVGCCRCDHRCVSCIGWRYVGHLERWNLGQVADYLLVLLAIFDSRGCKSLVLILTLGWEERGRHGLLNAFHFVWLVANQSSCNRVVTLLDSTWSCNRHV